MKYSKLVLILFHLSTKVLHRNLGLKKNHKNSYKCSLFRCYVSREHSAVREREGTERTVGSCVLYPLSGPWPLSSLCLCSLYCVTLARAASSLAPGCGEARQARLLAAIIHYWSIVHSLSTNGLARPAPRPRTSGSPGTGDSGSGCRTGWAQLWPLSPVTRAGLPSLRHPAIRL